MNIERKLGIAAIIIAVIAIISTIGISESEGVTVVYSSENNTFYYNDTFIYNNTFYINNGTGGGIPMGAISDSEKYSLYLNGVLVMKVNSTGTFIKGDIHTNNIIETNKSNTFSFYVNGTAYAQINTTGDLIIKSDIYTNEVLS